MPGWVVTLNGITTTEYDSLNCSLSGFLVDAPVSGLVAIRSTLGKHTFPRMSRDQVLGHESSSSTNQIDE